MTTTTTRTLRDPKLATLAQQRAELKAELARINDKLETVEALIRTQVGVGYSMVDKGRSGWMELTVSKNARVILDQQKVRRLLKPAQIKACLKTIHYVSITQRAVDAGYVAKNY